jgi:3-methyladenine DNA glycosylase AlkD
MTPLTTEVIRRVDAALLPLADPERAVAMRAYQRDQFPFLGIPAPARVAALRTAVAGTATPTAAECEALVRSLWARPEREYQYAAQWYLRRHLRRLSGSFLPVAHDLITTKSWWDTVDDLAIHLVGTLVHVERDLVAVMDEWIDSPNLWLARTAILHQNRWKADTDADRLFAYCLRRADDREFFIRKAIGWALREHTKTDPDAVRRFLADHGAALSGLSRREALMWLERRARHAARTAGSA